MGKKVIKSAELISKLEEQYAKVAKSATEAKKTAESNTDTTIDQSFIDLLEKTASDISGSDKNEPSPETSAPPKTNTDEKQEKTPSKEEATPADSAENGKIVGKTAGEKAFNFYMDMYGDVLKKQAEQTKEAVSAGVVRALKGAVPIVLTTAGYVTGRVIDEKADKKDNRAYLAQGLRMGAPLGAQEVLRQLAMDINERNYQEQENGGMNGQ